MQLKAFQDASVWQAYVDRTSTLIDDIVRRIPYLDSMLNNTNWI